MEQRDVNTLASNQSKRIRTWIFRLRSPCSKHFATSDPSAWDCLAWAQGLSLPLSHLQTKQQGLMPTPVGIHKIWHLLINWPFNDSLCHVVKWNIYQVATINQMWWGYQESITLCLFGMRWKPVGSWCFDHVGSSVILKNLGHLNRHVFISAA